MFYDADIDIWFTDFGMLAAYTPTGGQAANIRVIFDDVHLTLEMLRLGLGYESTGPQAVCKTSDVASAKHGDSIVIGSTTYYVTGVEADGIALTTLRLSQDVANV